MTRRPFRSRVFLYRTLAAVLLSQFVIVGYAFLTCGNLAKVSHSSVKQMCPEVAQRSENLFSVAMATVLSLLGADTIGNK